MPTMDLLTTLLLLATTRNPTTSATRTFDPFLPLQSENFDPAFADPRGNITCLGTSYELRLPTWDGFNPNEYTMQQLCAKPQYGGNPPGRNLGAYCYYNSVESIVGGASSSNGVGGNDDNLPSPHIMFDPSLAARSNRVFRKPRILLGCAYRCFCNFGLDNNITTTALPSSAASSSSSTPISRLPRQPKKNFGVHEFHTASNETHYLQIDINDEIEPPFYRKPGPFGKRQVKTLGIESRPERRAQTLRPFWSENSLDPGNLIECFGDLPPFEPPLPMRREDFRNVQQMCAVQLSHGNSYVFPY